MIRYERDGRLRLLRRTPRERRFARVGRRIRGTALALTPDANGQPLATWITHPRHARARVHVAPLRGG